MGHARGHAGAVDPVTSAAARETAVIVCPGRGDYGRDELGYLARHHRDKASFLATIDSFRRAHGRVSISELDAADRYSAATHAVGDNASALIYACAIADVLDIDRDRFDIVAVTGNSLGWYLALAAGGAVDDGGAIGVVDTMGALMAAEGEGGQLVYPLVDADWRRDPSREEAVAVALEAANATGGHAYWSIRLGGMAVLAGDTDGLAVLEDLLPAVDERYPFRLARHAAFHTPLMEPIGLKARAMVRRDVVRPPTTPLIDGRGVVWRPLGCDLDALFDYTLNTQVVDTYDFTRALTVALTTFAPDRVIVTGPGVTLGPPIAQTLIALGWRGLRSREHFVELQAHDPFVLAMARPEQRARVASPGLAVGSMERG